MKSPINKTILNEINNKRNYLIQHPSNLQEHINNYLIHEANQHSLRIETPKAIVYNPKKNDTDKVIHLDNIKLDIVNLQNAWEQATSLYQEHKGTISEKDIRLSAWYIDPELFTKYSNSPTYQIAQFRRVTDSVRPSGAEITPPNAAKIPLEMTRFEQGLDIMEKLSPLEQAIFFHLHFARIHPLPDGNGRTSRLIQNVILAENNYAPAIIYEAERKSYHNHLANAIKGFKNRDGYKEIAFNLSEGEVKFFDYLAEKVSINLDRILDSGKHNEII